MVSFSLFSHSDSELTCFCFDLIFQSLGYRVVASSSTAVKQDYNEYMWTMREVATDNAPLAFETASTVERDNLASSTGKFHHSQVDLPDE